MTRPILIVEDDDQLRDVLRLVLTEEGFEVIQAPNGKAAMEALEVAKADRKLPVMIILDLNMPVINGWEVAKWLDADPVLGDIPVIVTSATHEEGQQAKSLHADAFLVKPFSTDEIVGVVGLFSLLQP